MEPKWEAIGPVMLRYSVALLVLSRYPVRTPLQRKPRAILEAESYFPFSDAYSQLKFCFRYGRVTEIINFECTLGESGGLCFLIPPKLLRLKSPTAVRVADSPVV